jgi:hypothetical protein
MVEQGLYQLIIQTSGIQSLLGSPTNSVKWVLAQQGTVIPYIVLSSVATTDTNTMAGPTGLRSYLLQVACYASDYYTSRTIAKAVRGLLAGYKGTLPDVNSTVVSSILCEKDWDMKYEEGSKGFIYGALLHFRIWFID